MVMRKDLHLRDDIDICVKKKWGRGLASIEDGVDTSIRRLEDCKKEQKKTDYSKHKQHKDQQNSNN